MKANIVLIFLAAVALIFSGCSPDVPENNEAAAVVAYSVADTQEIVANPAGAIKAVYDSLDEYSASRLKGEAIEEAVGISADEVADAYVYISDVKYGLCDIIIVQPEAAVRDAVKERLYKYKEQRINEFERYDILGAYSVAQNAIIYEQGEYVILLMLADNESARVIIDGYIPQ